MVAPDTTRLLREKWRLIGGQLDERLRRLWAATEAHAIGFGGISAVAIATGVSVGTIRAGIRDLLGTQGQRAGPEILPSGRQRRHGAGRKALVEKDPEVLRALERLLQPVTRGDPMSPLLWTCKSTRALAGELANQGHTVSHMSVATLLHKLGFSLQSNRKTKEGTSHPDRDGQFIYINEQAKSFQERGQPVISVDTKKKELVGDFKNAGWEWRPKGDPVKVRVHDFPDPALGKVVPYGVYDLTQNKGWVSVGTDSDTAEFAVESIRRWWKTMGSGVYHGATQLLITADSGGSNGARLRLWKVALQRLADETCLAISVCHLPPGTSKWNKIEHRMFCHITRNWRGRPLESHEVIVNLIASTTTERGLQIQAAIDTNTYPKGIKVTDDELAQVRLQRHAFHGDGNYTIRPRPTDPKL